MDASGGRPLPDMGRNLVHPPSMVMSAAGGLLVPDTHVESNRFPVEMLPFADEWSVDRLFTLDESPEVIAVDASDDDVHLWLRAYETFVHSEAAEWARSRWRSRRTP